jgi:hypothetical protein
MRQEYITATYTGQARRIVQRTVSAWRGSVPMDCTMARRAW